MRIKAIVGAIIGLLCACICFSMVSATSASAAEVSKVQNAPIEHFANIFGTTSDLLTSSNPNLDCQGSGEIAGPFPGWSSGSATRLTLVKIEKTDFGVYWCPAAAPYGRGVITYTVTAPSGDISCVTNATSCEMSGITNQTELSIMATDETGSYPSNNIAIQNNGMIEVCRGTSDTCDLNLAHLTFATYGNDSLVGLQDCTFAAVANWEKIVLGTTPDPTQIESEFSTVDPGNFGLTNDQVFSYWSKNGIGQTHLKTAVALHTDPVNLVDAINNPAIKAPIAELHFSIGQNFAGLQIQSETYHWVVVNGYTPTGPTVVSWGKTLQMTWQQWNLEVAAMWGVSVSV